MEKVIFGEISEDSFQVIEREERYFIRYDAGAHQVAWRQDEISKKDALSICKDASLVESVLLELQRKLIKAGAKPYAENWSPSESNT